MKRVSDNGLRKAEEKGSLVLREDKAETAAMQEERIDESGSRRRRER